MIAANRTPSGTWFLSGLAVAVAGLTSPASAQVTERVSVGLGGIESNDWSILPYPGRFASSDGRFTAFMSHASNLVPGDTNAAWDVFVRDRVQGSTERVSVDGFGSESDGLSGLFGICISDDGRYVVFESEATNLVSGDTNHKPDLFLRDRLLGTTERVSVDSSGGQADAESFYPSVSADGRFVAFVSLASNLVPGDTNGFWDVFVRDRLNGTTELVSVGLGGALGDGDADRLPSISADGRYIAFSSYATNLVAGDTNGQLDVFVRDRWNGTTVLASVDSMGGQGNSFSYEPAISEDGRFVAYTSSASNLVPGDTNGVWDVFVRDLFNQTTECASVSAAGVFGDYSSGQATISADGRFVAFTSGAGNLCAGDTNLCRDGFVRDRLLGTTERVTVSTTGQQSVTSAEMACISADGRFVVFTTDSQGLVAGDNNGVGDDFIHDRRAAGFASLCDPGLNNVIACPCGNSPSGAGRGCDNSSFTGGAVLSASGIAYLSTDSLAFTTNDEKASATSVLLQGDALVSTGLVFGQGVRCVGGQLRRMYVKIAANGSVTAPDLGAGDPTVSARSAQLGAPIQPGQPYYYLVYYRDPIVLGNCSAAHTFNATQTGSVTYWP
jgi:Tol biopolymer transport system component